MPRKTGPHKTRMPVGMTVSPVTTAVLAMMAVPEMMVVQWMMAVRETMPVVIPVP